MFFTLCKCEEFMWCLKKQKLDVISSSAHYSSTTYVLWLKNVYIILYSWRAHTCLITIEHVTSHAFHIYTLMCAKTFIDQFCQTYHHQTFLLYSICICMCRYYATKLYCTYIPHTSIPYHHYRNNNQLQTMWLLINLLLLAFETEEKLPVIHCWLL